MKKTLFIKKYFTSLKIRLIKKTGSIFFGCIVSLLIYSASFAQKLDVAYVPTPDFIVEKMLDMANVGQGDYLIDLGCGDGRIVIAAAKRGALAHGVDLDPQRITEARENAVKAGVADRVVFVNENIYDTDFSKASVIAMYLFPDINIKLRPSLLEKLEPGSRIVSHDFAMDEWKPDLKYGRMDEHAVYLWIVPADLRGTWKWQTDGENFEMTAIQYYQKPQLNLFCGSKTLKVENCNLSGKRISFTVCNESGNTKFNYYGQIEKNEISGIVQVHGRNTEKVFNWNAFRK